MEERRVQSARLAGQIRRICKERDHSQSWVENDFTGVKAITDLNYCPVVTKQPIDFTPDGYRVQTVENRHRVKIFVVVTMYNEGYEELELTLKGICDNLYHLCKVEGEETWKEFCVCIVSDGVEKANKETLEYGEQMGFFDEKLMKEHSHDIDVQMHLFEITTQNFQATYNPLQIMFALKQHNAGKLNSHLWFFNAFADQIQPKYCMLLDVGTKRRKTAMYQLYRAMEDDKFVAGVCGEIAVAIDSFGDYFNPIIASQVFEYKVSHFLDKSLESAYGYISVLPGAFSAYRWKAIKEENGIGPLVDYFMSSTTPMKELGAFKANMYLAEDRILCFELIARKGSVWRLQYVKNAVAETDVPVALCDLIGQRRRWLNGSFFALLYAIINFNRYWNDSRHPVWRKISITTQFAYYVLNVILTWILLGNFFLSFYFLINSYHMKDFFGIYAAPVATCSVCFYILITLAQIVCGLGNKPSEVKALYYYSTIFYGFYSLITVWLSLQFVLAFDTTVQLGFVTLHPTAMKIASGMSVVV